MSTTTSTSEPIAIAPAATNNGGGGGDTLNGSFDELRVTSPEPSKMDRNAPRFVPQGMTKEETERFTLLTRGLHSWIDPDLILKRMRSPEGLRIYWGTATTGKPHLGYLVPVFKLADFLAAGAHVTVLFADLHAFLDNAKSTWEVLEHRLQFYEVIIKAMLKEAGADLSKLKFVRGSSYQLSPKYTKDVYRLAAKTTTLDTTRAGAEVVKQTKNPLMSAVMYPILQALDEEYLDADVQFGGTDQRKIFMFSRDHLPSVGYKKRGYLLNPLVPGLGKSGKMSSSEPLSKIDFDDSHAEVEKKIRKSFCVDGDPLREDGQPHGILCMVKYIIFRMLESSGTPFQVERDPKWGGGTFDYANYDEVQRAFGLPDSDTNRLASGDLKRAVIKFLSPLLDRLRAVMTEHNDLISKSYPDETSGGGKKKQQQGKAAAAGGGGKKGGGKAAANTAMDASRLDMRVGRIVSVEQHPEAESLYVEKIDVGEETGPRQVVSGLVKHVPLNAMKDRLVVVLCNLKPSKLRGIVSDGMVLCACLGDTVLPIAPPACSPPGTQIAFEGLADGTPYATINTGKSNNVFNGSKCPDPIGSHLNVNADGVCCWREIPMKAGQDGECTSAVINATIQ